MRRIRITRYQRITSPIREYASYIQRLDNQQTQPRVLYSRSTRLIGGGALIHRILIFDNHPATIRLLTAIDRAEKRETRLIRLAGIALVLLLILAILWPLL